MIPFRVGNHPRAGVYHSSLFAVGTSPFMVANKNRRTVRPSDEASMKKVDKDAVNKTIGLIFVLGA